MEKFRFIDRVIKWDFYKNELPSDVQTIVKQGATITPMPLSEGGSLLLTCPSLGDEASVVFPALNPSRFDEIRFKILVDRNDLTTMIRFGFVSQDEKNRIVIRENGMADVSVLGTNKTTVQATSWGVDNYTWLEVIWKPKTGASWYIADRVVAKEIPSNLPNPELLYYPYLLSKYNVEPTNIVKKVNIYGASLQMIVYSK